MVDSNSEQLDILELSGWVKYKFGEGTWHRRFAVLNESTFNIFKDQTRNDREVQINLSAECGCNIVPNSPKPRFAISIPGNPDIYFTTDTTEECTRWVNCIKSSFNRDPVLSMDSFTIVAVLGRGFFGKVMLVKKKDTGELYAVKSIHKQRLIESNMSHTVLAERNILLKTSNPFIVRLCFAFQTSSKFYLGLEYGAGGELFYLMDRAGALPVDLVRLYVAEIALALHYLHTMGIIYRDLKPENILLDAQGHIKLTDFGLSKDMVENSQKNTHTLCGTTEYIAPEMILRQAYSYSIDWWALGILTYEMLSESTPFMDANKSKTMQMIVHSEVNYPESIPQDAQEFIAALLTKDPKLRPDFDEFSQMEFFKPFNWEKVYNKEYQPIYVPESKDLANFDPEFTSEIASDSVVQPAVVNFPGFSYTGSVVDPAANQQTDDIPYA